MLSSYSAGVERSSHAQDVNDWLQARSPEPGEGLQFLCECGESSCQTTVTATREQYLVARESPAQLLVASDHHDDGQDRIVHAWGTLLVVAPRLCVAVES